MLGSPTQIRTRAAKEPPEIMNVMTSDTNMFHVAQVIDDMNMNCQLAVRSDGTIEQMHPDGFRLIHHKKKIRTNLISHSASMSSIAFP